MNHPWDFGRVQADDMESLHADVMRFIAILGLCLAAIFSLVNAAQTEDVAVTSVAGSEVSATAPKKQADETSGVVHEPLSRPIPVEPTIQLPVREDAVIHKQVSSAEVENHQRPVFTLEFESPKVLQSLVSRKVIELYALTPDGYWRYSSGMGLEFAQPPVTYYAMQEATVPVAIRSSVSNLQLEQAPDWGVTLPPSTAREISRLMAESDGGSLVIGGDAGVYLAR